MPDARETSPYRTVEDRLCRSCQAPLPFREQPKSFPTNISRQPTQSSPAPMEDAATAQTLLPQVTVDRSLVVQNKSTTQRLEVSEETFRQQEAEKQAEEKAAIDRDRLVRLETALVSHGGHVGSSTPSMEPLSLQSPKLLNALSKGSRRMKGLSRFLGRAHSSPESIR